MWTKKELETQDPAERPAVQAGSQTRFTFEERIEVVRKVATSREERDRLRAELESQGYTVAVRETTAPPAEGEYYTATLLAEKRDMVKVDTWAVERDRLSQKKREKKIDLTAKLGFWIAVTLAALALLFLLGPLIRVCRAL